jgi:hypothetical protein
MGNGEWGIGNWELQIIPVQKNNVTVDYIPTHIQ